MSALEYPREWFRADSWRNTPTAAMVVKETTSRIYFSKGASHHVTSFANKDGVYEQWFPTREEAQAAIDARKAREATAAAERRVRDAAPELLDALDFMANVARMTPGFSPMALEKADHAIAKVRGGA